jgi:cell division protein FtsZ
MDQAANRIREEVDEDANIMVGMALDESLAGKMRISVVATGIDSAAPAVSQMPKLQVVGGGAAEPLAFPPQAHMQAVAQPAAQPVGVAPAGPAGPASQGAGYIPQAPTKPLLSAIYQAQLSGTAELELPETEVKAARPAAQALPANLRAEPAKRASLFSRVFGAAPPPAAPPHREPVVAPVMPRQPEPQYHANHQDGAYEPAREAAREPARAAVRPAQIDDIELEIPAFLRRSQ